MTNNDNQSDDKELKSYLDGSDGVSAAYKHTATEEPGQDLDALILQAAHAAVATRPRQERTQLRGLFSLAASMIVGVMIGAVSMGYLDIGTPVAEFSAPQSIPVTAPSTNESTFLEAAETSSPEADNAGPARQEPVVKSEAAASASDAVLISSRLNLAPQQTAPLLRRQSDTVEVQQANAPLPATAPLPVTATATGPAQTAVSTTALASTALAPATVQLTTAPQPEQQADSAELEEIVVTGARIVRREFSAASPIITTADPNTAPWRATSASWLQHIANLRQTETTLLDELEAAELELSEEEALFRLAWPDLILETELEQFLESP